MEPQAKIVEGWEKDPSDFEHSIEGGEGEIPQDQPGTTKRVYMYPNSEKVFSHNFAMRIQITHFQGIATLRTDSTDFTEYTFQVQARGGSNRIVLFCP